MYRCIIAKPDSYLGLINDSLTSVHSSFHDHELYVIFTLVTVFINKVQ
jgi:hypothetical protein